jgi:hypothetical protein
MMGDRRKADIGFPMRRRTLLAGALLCAAPAAAEPRPAILLDQLAELDRMCREAGGTPRDAPALVRAADHNGDGAADYVVDVGAYECEGAASLFGGTAGSPVVVYASLPGGAFKAGYDDYAYGVEIEPGPPARAWIALGGRPCGQQGTVIHATMLACSRALVWNAAAQLFAYAPLAEARPIR